MSFMLRHAALSLVLALASFGPLGAQQSQAREPKRPKLGAGADTNSAGAYYQYGFSRLTSHPGDAADAFYWATRLDPSAAEPWYARWVASLLAQPTRVLSDYIERTAAAHRSAELQAIDSLRYQALLREPLLFQKLDATLLDDYLMRLSHGEVRISDVRMTGNPALDGWLAYGAARFGEAVKQYAIAVRRYPKWYGLHDMRARAFIPMLQYDSAVAEFTEFVTLQRKAEEEDHLVVVYESKELAEFCIGRVREIQDQRDSARAAYGRALTENLAFYPAHVALARVALAAGDTGTALKEYELAVQLSPERADIRYGYGALLLGHRAYEDAADQFRLAVEANPDYVMPYYPLAYLREGEGKDSLAIAYYTRFVQGAPWPLAAQVADARRRLEDLKRLVSQIH